MSHRRQIVLGHDERLLMWPAVGPRLANVVEYRCAQQRAEAPPIRLLMRMGHKGPFDLRGAGLATAEYVPGPGDREGIREQGRQPGGRETSRKEDNEPETENRPAEAQDEAGPAGHA